MTTNTGTTGTAPRVEVLADGGPAINGHRLSAPGKPWKYTKTPEFVLYLLLHPAGASQDRIMEALFPAEPVNRQRINLLASDARTKILGPATLPLASPADPHYRLDTDRVSFDLWDFAAHCARADRAELPADRVNHLTAALGLVTGRPFDLPHTGYRWADIDTEATTIKIEQTALTLAALANQAGDHDLAVWATTRAMLGGTGSVELLVARGRSALLALDPEAIVRAFGDLHTALGADPGEDLDWLDDALVELITELDRYRRHRLGHHRAA